MADEGQATSSWSRIPTWDGTPSQWKAYKRAVELWIEGENLDVHYSLAARLVTRLTGTARMAADLIPLDRLRAIRGVQGNPRATPPVQEVPGEPRKGLDHLMAELEKLPGISKTARKGGTMSWFYRSLSRRDNEAMFQWIVRYRDAIRRASEDGCDMSNMEDLGGGSSKSPT